tara:strand:+ start:656 stop:901 length:246 start_codon:yes stop_codon:yes gene_type:complete
MFADKCKVSIILAYTMLAYTFASMYYMINTRNIGTPFKDSLNQEQLIIRKRSANIRRNIFRNGMLIAIVGIFILKPFAKCN